LIILLNKPHNNNNKQTNNPDSYIYNRVSLEAAPVRAAAVAALAQFGERRAELRAPVGVLLRRCVEDSDDEVP
jgi:hypothetical protein